MTNPIPFPDVQKATIGVDQHGLADAESAMSAAASNASSEAEHRQITGFRWVLVVTAILSSIFFYALDNTVVADLQAVIVERFGQVNELVWLSTAFLLGATATNLVWGRVYTQFNSKWVYIFNVVLFEIGSVICGSAPNMTAMIIGRAVCGVGGAGLYVGVMTLIAVTTTIPECPVYVSLRELTWGLGIVLGPIIGGAFSVSSVGWRWAFYINLLIGAVCAPVYVFLLPSIDPRPGVSRKERAAQVDYIGIILQMGMLTSIILAINWGGINYAWSSVTIIGLLVTAAALLVLLIIQQVLSIATDSSRRIIPIELFYSRTVLILFSVTAASGASAFVPFYIIPIYFQFTRPDGPLVAGVHLLPFIVVLVVTILINGLLMSKLGYYSPWYTAGGALTIIGSTLLYNVKVYTSTESIYGYTVILGCGVGLWIQASFSVAQAVVAPALVPAAVGFITLAQFLGITLALAIANAILLNTSETRIQHVLPNAGRQQIRLAMEGAGGKFITELDPTKKALILDAIVDGIDRTYILVITAGAVVLLLSILLKRERLFVKPGQTVAHSVQAKHSFDDTSTHVL